VLDALRALMEGRELLDLRDIVNPPAWMADAACREHQDLRWINGRTDSTSAARAVCAGCLVREECLHYALADVTIVGMWGGTSTVERQHLRARSRSHLTSRHAG
jgi:WhiB family redox-sensing transcriptional regulator